MSKDKTPEKDVQAAANIYLNQVTANYDEDTKAQQEFSVAYEEYKKITGEYYAD